MTTNDRGASLIDVSIDRIAPDDTSFRMRVRLRTSDLEHSIARHGQQAPVALRRDERGGLQVICGHRRVAAMRRLGVPTVRAVVHEGLSRADALRMAFLDNEVRRSTSDVDRALAIAKLREEHGYTVAEVCRSLGLARTQIYRLCRLLTFPSVLRRAVDEGRVPTTHALTLVEMLGDDVDDERVQRWIARIERSGLSVSELRRRLKGSVGAGREETRRLYRSVDAGQAVRLLPVKIDPAHMDAQERGELVAELKRLLQLLEPAPARSAGQAA